METQSDSTLPLLTDIVRCLDEKKAEDLRVLKVGAQSSITDYLVLATGTSEPHLRALRVELEKVIDQRKAPIAGMDSGEPGSGWTVVDAYQVMVHLFTAEKREQYRLENLWKDAQDVSVQRLLHPDDGLKASATPPAAPAVEAGAISVSSPIEPVANAALAGKGVPAPRKARPSRTSRRAVGSKAKGPAKAKVKASLKPKAGATASASKSAAKSTGQTERAAKPKPKAGAAREGVAAAKGKKAIKRVIPKKVPAKAKTRAKAASKPKSRTGPRR